MCWLSQRLPLGAGLALVLPVAAQSYVVVPAADLCATAPLDTAHLALGLYHVRLTADAFVSTARFTVVR
ncbi:hypothetical protein B1759_16770 [Rubrivirga sp. SAORIC476]|uniref:hypothetical protein n=1 Tax=Rubrivirga sp. SAORIC476 TaxID=1961794 RepID=UPI000BA9379B|nr:hypothetical protein [Rubrivirga sp. SAORIC476]MAQ92937.1 hypothetical protein [Rhodothermaceae bacterium]MBC14945.1 hypothetical protein [Rhodothermaceae bacterium]PAP74826.1 hypothetical protein B1759_16770 [Rubrivirga sp. SAORIC476]